VSVGCDKEGHMEIMNEFVFDERMDSLSESSVDLMRQLMHPDPRKRMTSEKFLQHPWIQGLTASWTTMGKTHRDLKRFWQNKFKTEIIQKVASTLGIITDDKDKKLSDKDLMDIFNALDLKKNGVLELEEIQTTFRNLGMNDKHIHKLFLAADLDGTGVIHFDEFQALLMNKDDTTDDGPGLDVDYLQRRFKSHIMNKYDKDASLLSPAENKTKLREIFNDIDLDNTGVLVPHDIRVLLRSAGEPEDVISRIVASLDVDQDGKISWSEFLNIMGIKEQK
jgi:Ca2+-binding EF-hand superfamily protein